MEGKDRKLSPQTQAVHEGHSALAHRGAVKPPLYGSSTYVFENAQQGKTFFEQYYGGGAHPPGYLYSRLDHPNLSAVEARLAALEGAEEAALFASGMAAISSALLAQLQPGDLLLHSNPLYSGTDYFLKNFLQAWGVNLMGLDPGLSPDALEGQIAV